MSPYWQQLGIFSILLLLTTFSQASANGSPKTLVVYGPGGPHHVLEECATLFEETHGIDVTIVKALPFELDRRLREDGDLYYGGAEYMLDDFDQRNPGVLDMSTVELLHPRRIGVIVRKGNPAEIKGIEDLFRGDVDLLDVWLENMRHFHTAGGVQAKIFRYEYTGQKGVSAWLATPELDAWITYKSWHYHLREHTDFIEFTGKNALRFTPMALTHRTPHRKEAQAFIKFLKSEPARQIFVEHGWE